MDVKNRVVVVTGGASGIGKALCDAFAQAGAARIVVSDIDGEKACDVARGWRRGNRLRRVGWNADSPTDRDDGKRDRSDRPVLLECRNRHRLRQLLRERGLGARRALGKGLGRQRDGPCPCRSRPCSAHEGPRRRIFPDKGVTAEATVVAGVGANILVGGTAGSMQLQTVGVTGQLGLNLAAAGTSMTLASVN